MSWLRLLYLTSLLTVAVPCLAQTGTAKSSSKGAPAKSAEAKPAKPDAGGMSPLLLGSAALNAVLLIGIIGLAAKRGKGAAEPKAAVIGAHPLLANAEVGVAKLSAKGHVLEANQPLQKIFGFSEKEFVGKNFSNLVHPDDLLQERRYFADIVDGSRTGYQVEQRYFDANGQQLFGRVSVTRESGGDAFAIATLVDVTRRQRAEDELKVTRDALHNLYQVVVGPELDLTEKMSALLNMGCRRFGLDTGVIGKIRGTDMEVLQVVSPDERMRRGKLYEIAPGTMPRDPDGPAASPAPHGLDQARVLHDWQNYPYFASTEGETYFGAPIIVFGALFGTINFTDPEPRAKAFEDGETELLLLMAQWLGNEIERIQARADLDIKQAELVDANARLEALATHDGLTGVKNRRAFDEQLTTEIQRARRYKTPLSLILLDVDKFKQFNDSFGHPAGDGVLKRVAQLLQASVRNIDFVARYGGEEFVVLLPNTDQEGCMILADRLRIAIESASWRERAITASFGAATLSEEIKEKEQLTATADSALYVSKEQGRNRVTHAADVVPEAPPGFVLEGDAAKSGG